MTVRHDVENLVGTVAQMVSVVAEVVEVAAEAAEAVEVAADVVVESNAQPTAVVELETERFDRKSADFDRKSAVVEDAAVEAVVYCSVVQIVVNPDCP